jgi:hypothetical protein
MQFDLNYIYRSETEESFKVIVPRADAYTLSFLLGHAKLIPCHIRPIVEIPDVNFYRDTIFVGDIYRCADCFGRWCFSGFCHCQEKCDGYFKGFFEGNKLIVEGDFKDGQPIGKLNYSDKNGNLILIEKYDKKGNGILKKTTKYNGYLKVFYEGKRLLIDGNFKNGKPIGKLKYKTADGSLILIEKYDKRGKGKLKKIK